MNAKRACLVALVMTLAGAARAQQYAKAPAGETGSLVMAPLPAPGPVPGTADAPVPPPVGPRLSDYILGAHPDCCGPIGDHGPISTELYVRWGPSVNLPTGFLSKTLETGWDVDVGGRVLFFNPEADAAWTIDLGISDVSNQGQHSDRVAHLTSILDFRPDPLNPTTSIPTRVNNVPVTVRSLNRTYVNLALGRECYLLGTAANCGTCGKVVDGVNWRVGFDVGGRWGTEKLQLHELKHRSEVIEGVFASLHSDLEIPWHSVVFVIGERIEWDLTWMHTILQDTPADLQNINVLMTLGVRY